MVAGGHHTVLGVIGLTTHMFTGTKNGWYREMNVCWTIYSSRLISRERHIHGCPCSFKACSVNSLTLSLSNQYMLLRTGPLLRADISLDQQRKLRLVLCECGIILAQCTSWCACTIMFLFLVFMSVLSHVMFGLQPHAYMWRLFFYFLFSNKKEEIKRCKVMFEI